MYVYLCYYKLYLLKYIFMLKVFRNVIHFYIFIFYFTNLWKFLL